MNIELAGNVALVLFFSLLAVLTMYLGLKDCNDSDPITRRFAINWIGFAVLSFVFALMIFVNILS